MPRSPDVIRDPIHNIIAFTDEAADRLLLDLINTREFQRLRRIKQLGFSDYVFPSATHSRLAHSIGVLAMTRRIINRLRDSGEDIPPEHSTITQVAALLHDVGHGPFSHAFEKVTGENHERRTREILLDDTEVRKRIDDFDSGLAAQVAEFFSVEEDDDAVGQPTAGNSESTAKTPTPAAPSSSVPKFLRDIVSSQLDADRFDYLLRDSYASGTDYGKFDVDWLIQQLYVQPGKDRICIGRKGVSVAERYVFARYHMYLAVYFHKTTRAAEVMLRLLFQRLGALAKDEAQRKRLATLHPHLAHTFAGERLPLNDYLELDDAAVFEFMRRCAKLDDEQSRTLASGILDRRLFKPIDVTHLTNDKVDDFLDAAKQFLKDNNYDPTSFVKDAPADTPYKPYNPDEERPATQIYVENADGSTAEISRVCSTIARLTQKYHLLRYYVPADVPTDVVGQLRSLVRP